MFFEDVVKKPEPQIKQLSEFIGKEMSDELIALITEKTKFSSMKQNKATHFDSVFSTKGFEFIRKEKVGDWKNYFTVEHGCQDGSETCWIRIGFPV